VSEKNKRWNLNWKLEAPPGFKRGMEVLQIPQVLYVVDSSCSLVSGLPSFCALFSAFVD